jgi:SAM-dependent methyltransferase
MSGPPPPINWDAGRYETFAAQLAPVSEHAIRLAAPAANETLLDIACGTGNAALLAARGGAIVSGVDVAPRLIEVARMRAADEGVRASFSLGDAESLPFGDATFDSAVSVFGLIFAPNARRAAAEALRVLRPGGRALVTAWCPGGGVDAMIGVMVAAVGDVLGASPARFRWGDRDEVGALAQDLGATVAFHDGTIGFAADSPEAFLAEQEAEHPTALWAQQVLAEHGVDPGPMRARALAALHEHNEESTGLRATSRYHVIELRPT